ncbi:hypothetical protein [Lacinutrix undariae]
MKHFFFLLSLTLLTACSKTDTLNNCNFLLDLGVGVTVNLNLPQFSQLQFTSNSVYIANQGNGGLIVTNVGSGLRAWDAADPNHTFTNSCAILTINGGNATCSCGDDNEYSLFTGQSLNDPLPCGLKEYRVALTGSNTYYISN